MGGARRVIQINDQVVGPRPPRTKTVRPRKLSDYPGLAPAHRDLVRKLASPLRMGPPVCDELVALVQHVFTEEEAAVARHLGLLSGRSAADLARSEHRTVEEVQPALDRLSREKRVIASGGDDDDRRYHLLPIVPGMFEMSLISHTPESLTDWHRRYIELFEALCDTGFLLDYQGLQTPAVRYLPVGRAIEAQPMALPADQLEAVFDRYDVFGVGQCQCRLAMRAVGKGCDKPLGNCTVMGRWAEGAIREGFVRQVSKKEAIEIKREAESHGLVTWMMNVQSAASQCSCSCCGCCCHALRSINEFNAPGLIAPPHFVPRLDPAKCDYCGRCALACPMGAIVVDMRQKTYQRLPERCIGCGLCVLACDQRRALTMQPVADPEPPYRNWVSLLAHATPGTLWNSWKLWWQRRSAD